jgi:hypothetical protein
MNLGDFLLKGAETWFSCVRSLKENTTFSKIKFAIPRLFKLPVQKIAYSNHKPS